MDPDIRLRRIDWEKEKRPQRCPRCGDPLRRFSNIDMKTNEIKQNDFACFKCIRVFAPYNDRGTIRWDERHFGITAEMKAKLRARASAAAELQARAAAASPRAVLGSPGPEP